MNDVQTRPISTVSDRPHAGAAPAQPAPLGSERRPLQANQPAPAATAINVQSFNAWYGKFQALQDITLQAPERCVTAFIGPSGCGKSTFLRWINRMNDLVPIARAEGKLELHNIDILGKSLDLVELRRHVGMVFQKPNPFPKSIYDNVAFGPRLHRKLSRSEMDDLVEQQLRQAALWDEVKDRLRDSALGLSGGQQQRPQPVSHQFQRQRSGKAVNVSHVFTPVRHQVKDEVPGAV